MNKNFVVIFCLFFSLTHSIAREFHVSITGNDDNVGTANAPFRTINWAAKKAKAGDTVTVHAGTYREWVNPVFGGTSNIKRILYRAAPDEQVFVKGSEVANNWQLVNGNVWKLTLPNSYFGNYNPYQDTIYADWFNAKGRVHHTGEVYLNGKSLYEVETLKKVELPKPLTDATDQAGSLFTWYCESKNGFTTIWANFQGKNPNKELTEINVRSTCFYPAQTGINYLTVRGFHFSQAATQFAPPTAEQNGAVGPHWAKGWIIENNIISDSKCSGISLGKEGSTGQNFGVNKRLKSGFQYQLEVVFKAIQIGWNRESIGSHIVRNNTIYNCEQAGIVGHLGCVFSEIYNNHIYNIYTKKQFAGDEMAGIKLHAALDVAIHNNRIHDNGTMGIWMDWQCQGTRISSNLLYRNTLDIMSEVNHGPFVVDNNILLSPEGFFDFSEGTAFAHNLITGKTIHKSVLNRYTPYHFPHSTQLAGTATIVGGDTRFYNNIFASINTESKKIINEEANAAGNNDRGGAFGLDLYNIYSPSLQAYLDSLKKENNVYVVTFAKVKQPVWAAGNVYWGEAKPFIYEKNTVQDCTFKAKVEVEERGNEVYLHLKMDKSFTKASTQLITTDLLGMPRIADAPFENPDGSYLRIDQDYLGKPRNPNTPKSGPFEFLTDGEQVIKVW